MALITYVSALTSGVRRPPRCCVNSAREIMAYESRVLPAEVSTLMWVTQSHQIVILCPSWLSVVVVVVLGENQISFIAGIADQERMLEGPASIFLLLLLLFCYDFPLLFHSLFSFAFSPPPPHTHTHTHIHTHAHTHAHTRICTHARRTAHTQTLVILLECACANRKRDFLDFNVPSTAA